jgi:hypothetical protein
MLEHQPGAEEDEIGTKYIWVEQYIHKILVERLRCPSFCAHTEKQDMLKRGNGQLTFAILVRIILQWP